MGMNADLICDAQLLIGMISQRLVPTLCPSCRIPWEKRVDPLEADRIIPLDEDERLSIDDV